MSNPSLLVQEVAAAAALEVVTSVVRARVRVMSDGTWRLMNSRESSRRKRSNCSRANYRGRTDGHLHRANHGEGDNGCHGSAWHVLVLERGLLTHL